MHWKAAVSLLWNGSESWGEVIQMGLTAAMAWTDSLWKCSKDRRCSEKYDFSTKCMRNERRSADPLEMYEDFFWGVLWRNTACSVGTPETRSRTRWRNSAVLPLTSTGPSQTCWQILFLFMSFLFPRTYSIFISYIYLFWESIFTGMR